MEKNISHNNLLMKYSVQSVKSFKTAFVNLKQRYTCICNLSTFWTYSFLGTWKTIA